MGGYAYIIYKSFAIYIRDLSIYGYGMYLWHGMYIDLLASIMPTVYKEWKNLIELKYNKE